MPRQPKRPELFEVEVILAARVNDEAGWDYLVKWYGYSENANSWEPEENVKECERLLDSFWDHIGHDDDDHSIGYQVNAGPAWIKREKDFFAREFAHRDTDTNTRKLKMRKAKSTLKMLESSGFDDGEKITIIVPPLKSLMSSASGNPKSLDRSPRKVSKVSSSQFARQVYPSTPVAFRADAQSDDIQHPPASPDSLFSRESSAEALPQKSTSRPQQKIKLLDVESSNISSGSSLSTKQRIFHGGGSNSDPNAKAKFVPPRPKKSIPLAKLGFKKHPALPPPLRDTGGGEQAVAETLFGEDVNFFTGSTNGTADGIPLFDSQEPTGSDLRPVEDRFFVHRSPEAMSPTGLPPLDEAAAADKLAADIDKIAQLWNDSLLDMSELALDSMSDDPVERHPVMVPKPTTAPLPRIPKMWKWSGALLVDSGATHARKLATISLLNPTATLPNGLCFDRLLSVVDSIQIRRVLNLSDLETILSACGPYRQLAKLGPDDVNDKDALSCLASFMDKQQQVALGPLSSEYGEVASVLVFPSTLRDLWGRFDVPGDLQQTGEFVAALIPWTMAPKEYCASRIRTSLVSFAPPDFKHFTSQAIQYLEFPQDLRKYMTMPHHPYCVWWSPSDGTVNAPGLETMLLDNAMKACRAEKVGPDHDKLRVVFVHVGAVKSLYRMSAITKKRQQRPEIHFYSYGSHPSVPSKQWGVRSIYPLGGIITFTPDALLDDPIGSAQLMRRIAIHPFWDCYLLPSALGMASRLLCEGADPLSVFHAGNFIFHDIVTLMVEGKVSLLRAPRGQGDSFDEAWVHWQLKLFALTASGLLEECLNNFSAQYANTPDDDLSSAVEAEIAEDLLHLQSSHTVIENYRRFVVIKATSSSDGVIYSDWLEWTTLDDFDTKDGFLQEFDYTSPS